MPSSETPLDGGSMSAHVTAIWIAGWCDLVGVVVAASSYWVDKKLTTLKVISEAKRQDQKTALRNIIAETDNKKRRELQRSLLPGVTSLPSAADFGEATDLHVETWSVSKEREEYIDRRRRGYISAVGGAFLIFAGANLLSAYANTERGDAAHEIRTWAISSLVLGTVAVGYATVPFFAARSAYRQRRLATAAAEVDRAITQATRGTGPDEKHSDTPKTPPLELSALFALNRRQLDQYQLLTQKQQRSSFRLAQLASVAAFLLLVAGIIVTLTAKKDPEKYVAGGLSGLGTALSSFLATTFFASHRDANRQLNRYYLEPQRTGRLLSVERVITAVKPLVLTSPAPATGGSANGQNVGGEPAGDAAASIADVPSTRASSEPPPQPGELSDNGAALIATMVDAVLGWEMPADPPEDKPPAGGAPNTPPNGSPPAK
jgi:hypothetical protein